MKKVMTVILVLSLTMCLCSCASGATSSSDTEAAAVAETQKEAEASTENETAEIEDLVVVLPEDNGMAGVYKWIEMAEYGLDTYLLLWDDGIGSIDIIGTGTVRGVFYDEETMQVADEGTVPQNYAYEDDTLIWTYIDEQGAHMSTFVKLTAEERAAYEALGVGSVVETEEKENTENETAGAEDLVVALPEDNGMAGVYKWIEMAEYGLDTYLLLWDDGIGSIDIIGTGTVRGVFYDEETMQVADEGTVPQNYTFADDTLIWTYTDEQGEHVSTFVRLTAEERAAYEALGVGSVE